MYTYIVHTFQDRALIITKAFSTKSKAISYVKENFYFKQGEWVEDSQYDACGNGYEIIKLVIDEVL